MSLALIAMASVKIFQNCKSFTSKFTVNILKKARCFEITDGTVRTLVWLVNKKTNKCLSMLTAAENGGLCGRITKNHSWDGSWWCSSGVTKAPECASALANLSSQMSISGVHDSSDCQYIHENSYRFYDSRLKFTSYKNLKPFVMVFEEA